MMSPEEAYKYDNTFRRVVDLMRAHLSVYEITPAELRQAAILAATMHEAQRVRPLFYTKPCFPQEVFIDEAKHIPPAMFGQITDAGVYDTFEEAKSARDTKVKTL